jgi:hypothetical protein
VIGGVDHQRKSGGGIQEGFTARGFDYAASGSGSALSNGTHTRALVMVHGEPGVPGYFVLLDEIDAEAPGAEARLALHPDSNAFADVVSGMEYESPIGDAAEQLLVTAFLGTAPSLATLLDGGLCAFDGNEFVGKYLEAVYPTDALGKRNIVTLILPHDEQHAKPVLERLTLAGSYSGARVTSGQVVDVVVESSGSAPVTLAPASFRGRGLHTRRVQDEVTHYFVRIGREFDDGSLDRCGFSSDSDVSLFVHGTEANVIAPADATVVFYDPGIVGATFDTPAGEVLSSEPGRIEIALEPGTHAFDLNTGAVLRLGR